MFEGHRQKAVILFALADVALTLAAFEAAYQTRVYLPLENIFFIVRPTKTLLLGVTLALWVAAGFWLGVYGRLYAGNARAAVYDTVAQVTLGTLGLIAFQYALKLDLSRAFMGLLGLYSATLLIVYRLGAGKLRGYLRRRFGAEFYYVVVGSGAKALDLARRLEAARDYGIRLLALVDPARKTGAGEPVQLQDRYPVHGLDELPGMLRSHVVDEVIFAVEQESLADLEEIFLICDEEGVRTRVMVDFFPHVHSKVYLDRFDGVPLLTFSGAPHDEVRLFVKRVFDVALASLSLLILGLPMLVLALLVRATSKGPAIFRQVRCGLSGRRFTFYKFRSMVDNAEQLQQELAHLNERDGPAFKMRRDPRLTAIGRYLRRFSIDEWPQIWNILRGDMSFVGPRPAVPSEVEHYKAWQRRRLRMRPGLTCLWALKGRDELDFETWMKLDLEYIDNWSLWLDFKILAQTIPRVLAGRGAH